jgi:hypothetical protein
MIAQLDLFRDAPAERAIAPSVPAWKARTLLDAKHYRHGDFDVNHFCDADAEEAPFMSHHDIYLCGNGKPDEYIGCIYRFSADLPWMVLSRGEKDSQVQGMSFDLALVALIEWRKSCDLRDKEQLEKWRFVKHEHGSK